MWRNRSFSRGPSSNIMSLRGIQWILLTSLTIVIALSMQVQAFDGQRQGFILGGGLGYAPFARNSTDSTTDNKSGVAINFMIGHGFNEHNTVVFLNDLVAYGEESGPNVHLDYTVCQGFSGVAYCRYFGQYGKAFYVTVGIGFQHYNRMNGDVFGHYSGPGALLGIGLETGRPFDIRGSLSFGKSDDSKGRKDRTHRQLLFTVSIVGF